jgi:hypothetical protein
VQGFKDFGNGVFFPMITEYGTKGPRQDAIYLSKGRSEVTHISLNESLPSEVMKFQFPENCLVTHDPPVNGRRKATLYGKDNQPLKEINSIEDLPPLVPELKPSKGFLARNLYLFGWLALGVLVAVAIFIRQKNS